MCLSLLLCAGSLYVEPSQMSVENSLFAVNQSKGGLVYALELS